MTAAYKNGLKVSIELIEDAEAARAIHKLAFPADKWVGDDHTFWQALDQNNKVVGFCSAIYRREKRHVYLSRAAVVTRAQGHGLQRRMIKLRVRWALEQGAKRVVTDAKLDNYESIANLIRCGFHFYDPIEPWGVSCHYFSLRL